ncbi:MAG: hypothetical protein R3E10_01440 [Gemmatimonadota bacterium]
MRGRWGLAVVPLLGALGLGSAGTAAETDRVGLCLPPPAGASDYYDIELVPTTSVPGARRSQGRVDVAFPSNPYGVQLSSDGSYAYDVVVSTSRLPALPGKEYAVWVATNTLDQVERLGTLDAQGGASGHVRWNKFLIVITLEQAGHDGGSWEGPVALRGLSRAGFMHTMAGHGPFEQENCASYGY